MDVKPGDLDVLRHVANGKVRAYRSGDRWRAYDEVVYRSVSREVTRLVSAGLVGWVVTGTFRDVRVTDAGRALLGRLLG